MKNLIVLLLATLILVTLLLSCSKKDENNKQDIFETKDTQTTAKSEITSKLETTETVLSGNAVNISGDLANEITAAASDFFGTRTDGYVVYSYGGEVEGCHICQIAPKGVPLMIEWGHRIIEIENYFINYPSSELFYAYKDGNFYTVKEAYDQCVLSMEGVIKFAEKTAYTCGYDLYPES